MTEIQTCVFNISTVKFYLKRKKKNSIQKVIVHYVHLQTEFSITEPVQGNMQTDGERCCGINKLL